MPGDIAGFLALSARLRERMNALAVNQVELAAKSGVSQGLISKYLRGRMPEAQQLSALSRALLVSMEWLLTGEDSAPLPQPVLHFAGSLSPEARDLLNPEDYISVPLVEDRVAAGEPAVMRDHVEGWAIVYRPLLGKRKDVVAVRVKGDSMEPCLPDGSMVIVDRADRKVRKGSVYAVRSDGGVTIKRVRQEGAVLYLIPDNREHRERQVELREGEPAPIVGRVVWSWRSWD